MAELIEMISNAGVTSYSQL